MTYWAKSSELVIGFTVAGSASILMRRSAASRRPAADDSMAATAMPRKLRRVLDTFVILSVGVMRGQGRITGPSSQKAVRRQGGESSGRQGTSTIAREAERHGAQG